MVSINVGPPRVMVPYPQRHPSRMEGEKIQCHFYDDPSHSFPSVLIKSLDVQERPTDKAMKRVKSNPVRRPDGRGGGGEVFQAGPLNSLCERESEISINEPREKKVKTKGACINRVGCLCCIINTGPYL